MLLRQPVQSYEDGMLAARQRQIVLELFQVHEHRGEQTMAEVNHPVGHL
jgi:hypothetical protein